MNMRIERVNDFSGAVDLTPSDVGRGVDNLALQIGQRDDVVIDRAERADTGGRQIHQDRRAEAAGADHQHGRLFQRGLPRATDFVQHDMAGVTFEFVGRQHGRVLPSLANPHGEERGTRVSNHEAPISPRGHPSRRPLRGLPRMRTSIIS